MNTSHDPVNPCTTLGHIYTSITVVRCPHLEAWSMTARCWSDNDRDEPQIHFEASREFGPFDSDEERALVAAELLELTVWHQMLA